MSKKQPFNYDQLRILNDARMSLDEISAALGVKKSTVKLKLRHIRGQLDNSAIFDFAKKLEELAKSAPDEFCRKKVNQSARLLRSRHALGDDQKKKLIFKAVISFNRLPKTLDEIAEDTNLSLFDCRRLIDEIPDVVRTGREYSAAKAVKEFAVFDL